MDFERDITHYRNLVNQHGQKIKKVTKAVEKETPFHQRALERLDEAMGMHGVKNRVKITRARTKNANYKARRLKKFSEELVQLDAEKQNAAKKQAEREERKTNAAALPQLTLEADIRTAFSARLFNLSNTGSDEALKTQYKEYATMVHNELLIPGAPTKVVGEFSGVCTALKLDAQACQAMMILFFE